MLINKDYICTNPANTGSRGRKGAKADYKWIAVHYTGALDTANPGNEQTAINNCKYYRDCNVGASANFYVDRKGVWMSVPWDSDRYAWHIGIGAGNTKDSYLVDDQGNMCCNPSALGVEICTCKMDARTKSSSDPDWYFDSVTYRNAIELIKYLMREFNIDINHVVRHYDANTIHKVCPSQFVGKQIKTYYNKKGDDLWQEFKNELNSGIIVKDVLQAYRVDSFDGELNLRQTPSNSGALLKVMHNRDFVLAIKEQSDGWMLVKYVADNRVYVGYCFKKYLKVASSLEGRCVQSPDGTLNIRANPSASASLIVPMGNDYIFTVLSKCNPSWGFIWCGETIGYCNITNNYSYKL